MSGVTGLTTSPAAFSQAQFDQTKRNIDLNGHGLDVQRRTQGGPGGGPVWTNTVSSENQQVQGLVAHGANATRLAPAQFQFDYTGGLLDQDFHLLNPAYGFDHVDFHA